MPEPGGIHDGFSPPGSASSMVPMMLLTAALLAAPVERVSDSCLSPAEARTTAAFEHLIEFTEAAKLASRKVHGEVVSANLCRVNQRLVYVLAILSPEGRVARVAVDAKSRAVQDHR